MACTLTINGRAFPCKDKIGGIKRVWIKEFAATDWGTITAGVVAAGATIEVFGFELTKNSGSFQQAVNASMENGVVFYSQVLEMTMPNLHCSGQRRSCRIAQGAFDYHRSGCQ